MKLKQGFLLRSVAGRTIVVPDGDTLDLDIMIALNDTGCLLWKQLETGSDRPGLIRALTDAYEVSRETAEADVDLFLEKLNRHNFLEP